MTLLFLAEIEFNWLLLLAVELNSVKLFWKTLGAIGDSYMCSGNMTKALFYFRKQVNIMKLIGLDLLIGCLKGRTPF